MAKRRLCLPMDVTGHFYRPLDGMHTGDTEIVSRLYCYVCGRVKWTTLESNDPNWQPETEVPTFDPNSSGNTGRFDA